MYHTPDEEIDETSLKTDYSNFLFALCMQKKIPSEDGVAVSLGFLIPLHL